MLLSSTETAGASTESASQGVGGDATDGGDSGRPAGTSAESTGGPRELWRARPVQKEYREVEEVLGISALATGSGLGLALLGVAPFTPPNPFMAAILLTILQVRVAHAWTLRQLQAQARRHVTKVELMSGDVENSEEALSVRISCDGGLTRTLALTAPSSSSAKPPVCDVMKNGVTFIFLDRELGDAKDEALLDAALLQSDRVISSESITVQPFEGEGSEDDALNTVQKLAALRKEDLARLATKEESSVPAQVSRLRGAAVMSGAIILTGGLVICLGGRHAADVTLREASVPPSR